MTVAMMLCGAVIGCVLTLAATVLHSQERAANRSVRWIWAAMIGLTVLLTAVAPARRQMAQNAAFAMVDSATALQPTVTYEAVGPTGAWNVLAARLAELREDAAGAVSRVVAPVLAGAGRISPEAARSIAFAWLAVSLACMLVLYAVYRRVRLSANGWTQQRVLGIDVRVSHDAGPAVVGLSPMEIVVPSWILARGEDDQRLVLMHEAEHVRARDPLLLLAACIAVAVMPWNPVLWYALSRLRLAVELDCDRRVLLRGASPDRYGTLLLDISAHPSTLASALPALSYSASHLERRLLAMTARASRFTLPRRALGGAVATLLLLAACESKLPTSSEIEAMDAKSAVKAAAALPGVDPTRTTYVLDGVPVSKSDAERVLTEKIASIEVVRGQDRASQIRVRTNEHALDINRPGGAGDKETATFTLSADSIRFVDSVSVRGFPADSSRRVRVRSLISDTARRVTGYRLDSTLQASVMLDSMRPDSGRVRIRGVQSSAGSIRFSSNTGERLPTQPDVLVVVDGVVVDQQTLSKLSPDRIESVEVIKGKAAVSLYGARAAAGVIKVTTKR
ncbi:MAG: M56 family metallopeptidase [Gemmatimonadota bacterium]